MGLPDEDARVEILRLHTARMPLAPDVSLQELAIDTAGYSGAELAALCREAAQTALYERLDSIQVRLLGAELYSEAARHQGAHRYLSTVLHQQGQVCTGMPTSLLLEAEG